MKKNFSGKIADAFGFRSHSTGFRVEIIGGVSTFLALSYIFVVNPAILSQGGLDKSAVFFATIVTSFIATLLMGLWANKPFAVAPGMEINAYVAFFVIASLGFTWQQALGAVFWSGIIFMIMTLTRVREKIIESIPDKMKTALSLSVGVFLMLIALRIAGIVTYSGITISGFGSWSPMMLVFGFGLLTVLVLRKLKIPGAVLIAIILTALVANYMGLGSAEQPVQIPSSMFSAVFQLDLGVIMNPKILSVILVLFIVDFYGSVAKFIGLSRGTSILDKKGRMPKMKEALSAEGVSNFLGSILGTTSLITYVESRVGIQEGARTGFAALVCALLIAAMFLIAPLVSLIPLIATTGALFWVGICLLPGRGELRTYSKIDTATLAIMAASVIATFAIDKALFFGFLTFIVGSMLSGRRKEINIYMIISALLLLIGIVLSVASL